MQVNVRRGGFGLMEGVVAVLGLGAGLLTLIEPAFRPIGLACIGAGAVLAGILAWRRGRDIHPSITPRTGDRPGEAPPRDESS